MQVTAWLSYAVPLVAYLFIAGMHPPGGANAPRSKTLGVSPADAREYHACSVTTLTVCSKDCGLFAGYLDRIVREYVAANHFSFPPQVIPVRLLQFGVGPTQDAISLRFEETTGR